MNTISRLTTLGVSVGWLLMYGILPAASNSRTSRWREAPIQPKPKPKSKMSVLNERDRVSMRMQMSRILCMLEGLPEPELIRLSDVESRELFLTKLEQIARYPTPILRAAVKRFLVETTAALRGEAKVMCLIRYIFAVPERVPNDVLEFHSWGFVGCDRWNYMRPLAVDAGGRIIFNGEFRIYCGPSYRGLEEFDFFHRRYGRRRIQGTRPLEHAKRRYPAGRCLVQNG